MSVAQQALSLFAADRGYMSDVEVDKILDFEEALHGYLGAEKGELENTGYIENATHIPRGLLEFSLNPNSPLVQNNVIDTNKDIVLFCAAGGRSALAAKTLKDMGFKNVSHIDGGFTAMEQQGFKVKK